MIKHLFDGSYLLPIQSLTRFATRKCHMLLYLHCLFMEVFQRPLVLFLFANRGCFSIADAKVRQKSESASISARKMHENTCFLHLYRVWRGFWEINILLHLFIFTRARNKGNSGVFRGCSWGCGGKHGTFWSILSENTIFFLQCFVASSRSIWGKTLYFFRRVLAVFVLIA
jgi:hypothetical protein